MLAHADTERLLRHMIEPNADMRATIANVVEDSYFAPPPPSPIPQTPVAKKRTRVAAVKALLLCE